MGEPKQEMSTKIRLVAKFIKISSKLDDTKMGTLIYLLVDREIIFIRETLLPTCYSIQENKI